MDKAALHARMFVRSVSKRDFGKLTQLVRLYLLRKSSQVRSPGSGSDSMLEENSRPSELIQNDANIL